MAKKATITPVTDTVNNAAAINTQLNAINNKLDNTLSLDGSVPNAMGADLDMNSNDILNVGNIQAADISIAGSTISGVLATADASAAAALVSENNASLSATQAAHYDGIWLDDVATLLADTTLTYTVGQPSTVVVGDYVRTRKEGFAYQVAASGDVTTAGGIQLDVMAGPSGYNVKAFGAVGDGVTNDTVAIQAAISASLTVKFPDGVYATSPSPAYAVQGQTYIFDSDVTIKGMSGDTGYVMDFDAGDSPSPSLFDVNMVGQVNIDCVATSAGPFRSRGVQHSIFNYKVLGSPTNCGQINFAVLNTYIVTASVNQAAFTITPPTGLILDTRGVGEYVADCDFDLTMEGITGTGLVINDAQCNRFKGTSEGNNRGVEDTAVCRENTFEEFWCEANTTGDFELYGVGTTLINCKALSSSTNDNVELVAAKNTTFLGGYLRSVDCAAGSSDSVFLGVRSSDNVSLGIKGVGSKKLIGCVESDTSDIITTQVHDQIGSSGTFTPVLNGGVSSPSTTTYTAQEGEYDRVGNVVHFNIQIALSALTGGTGIAIIQGLPFPARSTSTNAVTVGRFDLITLTGGRYELKGEIPPNQSYVRFYASGFSSATGTASVNITDFQATSAIVLSGSYLV